MWRAENDVPPTVPRTHVPPTQPETQPYCSFLEFHIRGTVNSPLVFFFLMSKEVIKFYIS